MILSEPACKDGNVRFTTVPLKPYSDQNGDHTAVFRTRNSDNFSIASYEQVTFAKKPQMKKTWI